jgi:PKD repeat protein
MKRFSKTIIFVLLLSVIPARIWAQDYKDYENGFLFNVFGIENVEERVQLASALATSDIWICNPTENPGELFIRPNSYNADIPIYAEFDYLRTTLREEYEEASSLPKEEFAEIYKSWAHNISSTYYNFLISDHLDRANHCMDAEPFCTSDVYNFPALNSGFSWSGPNYGCLGTSPTNKHSFWYYMRIGVAGNITILIEASFDVDFALWGPFNNQTEPCPTEAGQEGLLSADCDNCPNNTSNANFYPSGNLHDCSFDARHYEYAHVVNGQVGQYYILLITNYSGSDGYITFQKYDGDGETDCGIMPGIVSNGGPYCVGETIQLTVNEQNSATYEWTGPNGFTSNQQNPTLPNCTMDMAGTYTCTTIVGSQSVTANTEVVIYAQPVADFDYTSVCEGNPTQFTSTAETEPAGYEITHYYWDFGDGTTAEGPNATHTYASAGEYQVTHFVETGGGRCTNEITQTVPVYAIPVATTSVSPSSVIYGGTATLTAIVDTPGNFTFHWEPANMVLNPNSQTTQTVPIQETQVFTVTITNTQGGCTSTAQATVNMAGSNLTATATADQYEICEDGSTTLHALPQNGTGIYTYSWTPTNLLNNPTIQNPVATPPVGTTTFTCSVGDGLTTQIVNVSIIVHPKNENEIFQTACDQFFWDPQGHEIIETDHQGSYYTTSSVYHRTYLNQHGCDSIVRLNLTVYHADTTGLISFDNECDSISFNWFGTIHSLKESGTYTFTDGETTHGCDSALRVKVNNMRYTPQPSSILCQEENAVVFGDTIAVITNTEFFSFQYDFHVEESVHNESVWDSCIWTISKPSWSIEFDPIPEIVNGKYHSHCLVYVADHEDNYVMLTATAKNDCNSETRRFFLKSSFIDVDEHNKAEADVSIVPNPNNGQMRIDFKNMEGRTNIRVFDMTGNQVDAFEAYSNTSRYIYDYTLKWNAQGIYFFVFSNDNRVFTKKVIIIQ